MLDFPGYSLSGAVASFFFVLLTMKQSDDFRVIGPAHPILARVGEEALLTCQLLPRRAAVHMEVRWYRAEPGARVLSAHQHGAEVPDVQTEDYRGRVEWAQDGLAEGRAALKLRRIRPSDDGQYWCRFQEGSYCGETSLLLQVAGLGSAPHIHMEPSGEGEIQLVCTAEGWFPEPQVYWENDRGERLLTFSEYHVQDEDGLFYVEATLVVRNASAETVFCFVHNPVLSEEKGSDISIPEKLQTELVDIQKAFQEHASNTQDYNRTINVGTNCVGGCVQNCPEEIAEMLLKSRYSVEGQLLQGASLKVIGPSQPLLVRVGEDIQLTCYLFPKADAENMEVRWVRSHRYPAVYVYMDGDHMSAEQMAEYRGRTVLVTDAINEGRQTLLIHDARTSDDGQYRCLFEKDGVYQENSLDLKIIALGSSPRITAEGLKDGGMRLRCTSGGWFPQPRVQWRDVEAQAAPASSQVLTQDSRGLFQVEALLVVTNSSVVNVTCSISNPLLSEEKTATFSLSDSRMTFSWKILLIWGLLLLVTIGLIKRKSGRTVSVTLDPSTAHPELFSLRERSVGPSDSHATRRPKSFDGLLRASGQEGLMSGRW